MPSAPLKEPDRTDPIIYVGQDIAGHWLVQDSGRRLEGRFVSFAAAMSHARAARDIHHGIVEIASTPLAPLVPFAPAAPHERAVRLAR